MLIAGETALTVKVSFGFSAGPLWLYPDWAAARPGTSVAQATASHVLRCFMTPPFRMPRIFASRARPAQLSERTIHGVLP
jgi:hypothetical protein